MALGCGRVSHVDVFALNARNTYTKSTVQLYGAAVWVEASLRKGVGLERLVQSYGSCRRTRERMCEPKLGTVIQVRTRKLGLSTTTGRFFSRSCGVHPMKRSPGASFHAAVLEPSMASGQPSR